MPAPVLISIGWWIFAYIHDWCEGLEWILWIVIYQWAILIYHQIIYGLDLHINKALIFTMWLMINLLGTLSIWCAGLKSALDIHVVGGHALFLGAHYLRSPKVEKCLRREECCPIRYIQKKTLQSHWKCVGSDWYLATMEVSCTTMLKPVGDLLLRNGPFQRPSEVVEELWRYDHSCCRLYPNRGENPIVIAI